MNLARTHRNFLVVLVFLLAYAVGMAWAYAFGPPAAFRPPSLAYVNDVPRGVWLAAYTTEAVLLVLGMWRTTSFQVARLGLAIGMGTCALRLWLLILAGAASFTGLPLHMLALGVHIASTLEPPSNPASQ